MPIAIHPPLINYQSGRSTLTRAGAVARSIVRALRLGARGSESGMRSLC